MMFVKASAVIIKTRLKACPGQAVWYFFLLVHDYGLLTVHTCAP